MGGQCLVGHGEPIFPTGNWGKGNHVVLSSFKLILSSNNREDRISLWPRIMLVSAVVKKCEHIEERTRHQKTV
jgi:hypothetical protein